MIRKIFSANRPASRPGISVPFLAITLVALMGSLALAIDLGMLIIAKAEVQDAADLAALTAARTLTGDATISYNQSAATSNAQNILTYNTILGQPIQPSQLQLTYGSYDYNQSTETFSANFPPTAGNPVTAVTATVTSIKSPTTFGAVLGIQFLSTVSATATAVHRPRDIALVLDLSGSMRMGTCLGFDFYTSTRTTNNPDPLYPTFGHYSSSSANMQGPSTNQTSSIDNYTISPSNTTAPNSSYSLTYVNNFYQNAPYATTLVRAFDSYTSTDGGSTWTPSGTGSTPVLPPNSYTSIPGGDVPLYKNGSKTTYAQTVRDFVNGSSRNQWWELDGYSGCTSGSFNNVDLGTSTYASGSFNAYTQGPGYYGKTFFIWPPDPRQPLTTANNSAQIQQFLTDFGYTSADFTNPVSGPPLQGIYGVTTTAGSQNWPWPNDNGTTLSKYLTTKVYVPGSTSRLLQTTDAAYQKIMRLYNWNYVVDNYNPAGSGSNYPGTTPCDWRVRFFGTNDNTKLFNRSTGSLNVPSSSTYTINYNEILRWIAASPSPFPQQLRAGRIKYYGSVPTQLTGTWPNYGSTDQRFWKEYIDYVLGFRQTGTNTYYDITADTSYPNQMTGYGTDFTWGSVSLSTQPSATQYMSYSDIPARPRLRYWFGPINMVDYLHNMNVSEQVVQGNPGVSGYFLMEPGDAYEAPSYSGKQSFLAAVHTMQTNHPNDWFTVICYSGPRSAANGTSEYSTIRGRFNCVRSPLGPNYNYALSSLLFPFSTINADGSPNRTEITPYDPDPATGSVPSADLVDTPRGDGDTCFAMGLMLAYNQFATTSPSDPTLRSFVSSAPIQFPAGMGGGMGRKGAQKVIIFETDGLANCAATATLVNAGSYKYYKIRYDMNNPTASEYPSVAMYGINNSTVLNQVYSLVQQLANDYGNSRNPFRLYAIGFGPVFQGPDANAALQTLQTMQYYAGTQASASTPLSPSQIITGTDAHMSSMMTNTFTTILESGVQIALIK